MQRQWELQKLLLQESEQDMFELPAPPPRLLRKLRATAFAVCHGPRAYMSESTVKSPHTSQ
jgi:hypothetical protein